MKHVYRISLLLWLLLITPVFGPSTAYAAPMRHLPSVGITSPHPQTWRELRQSAARVDAYLSDLVRSGGFSGSVLIARGGDVLLRRGYGSSGDRYGTPNTPQTKFHLASISKQFTAMAILMLQADGGLNVQDRICRYVPGCPTAWGGITLHELLTHTSGIPDYMNSGDFGALQQYATTPEQLIASFKDRPLDFVPGTQWRYSNSGYVLLGYVVERVSGMSYGDFLQRRIFGPLGMADTGYDHGQRIAPPLAYSFDNSGPAGLMNMASAYAAGGLYSTVDDLYRWDEALYDGRLLPPGLLDLMFTPHAIVPANGRDYGYGWLLGNRDGLATVEHAGSLNDFSTEIIRIPHDRTTVIILGNQALDMDDLSGRVVDMIYSQ